MHKKIFIVAFCLLVLVVLCSCSFVSSETPGCILTEVCFESVTELMDYIKNDKQMLETLLKQEESMGKNTEIRIFMPGNAPIGMDFRYIRYSGNYIAYRYALKDYLVRIEEMEKANPGIYIEDPYKDATEQVDPEPNEAQNEIQKELNELGQEGYIEKYGLQQVNEAIIEMQSTIDFVWAFAMDGEALLKYEIETYELRELPGYPGYYYEEVGYPGVEGAIRYQIRWVEEGYHFFLAIPIDYFDHNAGLLQQINLM